MCNQVKHVFTTLSQDYFSPSRYNNLIKLDYTKRPQFARMHAHQVPSPQMHFPTSKESRIDCDETSVENIPEGKVASIKMDSMVRQKKVYFTTLRNAIFLSVTAC